MDEQLSFGTNYAYNSVSLPGVGKWRCRYGPMIRNMSTLRKKCPKMGKEIEFQKQQ